MTDHITLSRETIQAWLVATRASRLPELASSSVLADVSVIKRVFTGDALAARSIDLEDILAPVSSLSNELLDAEYPSRTTLRLARSAFHWLSKNHVPADQFDEVPELLARLAFVAWRHSRRLEGASACQVWLERFDQALLAGSASLDCLRSLLESESEEFSRGILDLASDPEGLFSFCALLREERNSWPEKVADRALALFHLVEANQRLGWFGDERSFFLSQLAITAAVCYRWIGDSDRSVAWLEVAELHNGATIVPELGQADIECARLVGLHEEGRFGEIVALLGETQPKLRALGMLTSLAKSEILLSDCLKVLGLVEESVPPLKRCLESPAILRRPVIRAFALLFLADSYHLLGRSEESDDCLRLATSVLKLHEGPTAVAQLGLVAGARYRSNSNLEAALSAFNAARLTYEKLGLASSESFARLLAAEVLLAMGRESDAKSEIILALPIIERAGLRAKGAAALALLRESMRREQLDARSVRDLAAALKGLPRQTHE